MVSGFDIAATAYDSAFTNTPVGKLQRERVYSFLGPYLNIPEELNILELNCGTGEDALFMEQLGHTILATDLSAEMLAQAKSKIHGRTNISFQQLDINDLDSQTFSGPLDLVFSNFGGLNCISPAQFRYFLKSAEDKLAAGRYIIAVIMSKKCLWERLYFLLKGQPKEAYRRTDKEPAEGLVEGKVVKTWYYAPRDIENYAKDLFSTKLVKPIGFLIPPSYLNSFFKNKKGLLVGLAWLDRKLFSGSFFSTYADHFIIVLQKK
jgi:SAM-dependent methyltransferase